ncbi:MAG: transcription termination/antitermination protein NusA [Lachnospiraceae bacterium]|nr:transcription termination/antitermination protein NusA [Lachnospiraceae bacterium]
MSEIIDALNQLEKEKGISKEKIMEKIEASLLSACEKDFGKDAVIEVSMDRETGEIALFQKKTVVEDVENEDNEISLVQAKAMNDEAAVGDELKFEIKTMEFGRIAAQKARSIIVQAIKEGERDAIYEHFVCKEKDIITGVVQRYVGNNISVSLDDRTDAILNENEQVKGEYYKRGDRIKLYVVEVKKNQKGGFKIVVSRTHKDLVRKLFEREVAEVADGTVEIKSISREPGSRSKIAVWSNDPNVDPVGACVGLNGTRVNTIVDDLKGEKIDIINWDEDPAVFIENALSPSKVVSVDVDIDEKSAKVVVPDYQLSLAIGKEGQNARLAARLTGYKIDIKSESQAGLSKYDDDDEIEFRLDDEYDEYDDEENYDEDGYEEEAYEDDNYEEDSYEDDNNEDDGDDKDEE